MYKWLKIMYILRNNYIKEINDEKDYFDVYHVYFYWNYWV